MQKRPDPILGPRDLTRWVEQVSRERPELLTTCLWLLVTNQASRRALTQSNPPAADLVELWRQPGDLVSQLIAGDDLVDGRVRQNLGAKAGLFPRAD